MTPDPTDNRATAERIARGVYDQYSKDHGDMYFPLSSQNEDDRERAILCALAGMAHRDRTAEREAASKALGYIYGQFAARPVVDKDVALAVVLHAVQSKEGYLAAEFDAGERVTLSNGEAVIFDGKVRYRGLTWDTIAGFLQRDNERGYVLTDAEIAALYRLAEQRGAER